MRFDKLLTARMFGGDPPEAPAASRGAATMKMRDLERRTGVNRETIRVYLRQGLMPEPSRPAPNVADYGEEHVQAVNSIRKLQKEKRLPLHLIKRALEGDPSAMPADATAMAFPHLDRLIASRVGLDDSTVPLSSVVGRNAKAVEDAKALEKAGVIRLVRRGKQLHLSRIDAQIVGIWGDMRAAGYTEELGFRPEVCKLHADSAEKLAKAELKIFLEHLEGRSVEGLAADMAQVAITSLLNLFGLVRVRTVLDELRNRRPRARR